MEWTGFTDEQLRQLKSGSDPESHSRSHPGRKSTESHSQGNRPPSTRLPPQRGRTPPSTQSRSAGSEPLPLSQNQMLSKPKQVPQQQRQRTNQRSGPAEMPGPVGAPSSHKSDRTKAPAQSNQSTSHVPVDKPSDTSGDQKKPELSKDLSKPEGGIAADGIAREKTVYRTAQKSEAHIGKELDEKEGLSRELSKLEEFQQRQKEIEDENQRKKNLLAMAIADRKKKTQAEVKRLAFIQKELSKIEQFLTTDVNILRDKIEEASRHYAEAQKRYKKAEAEFVTAKINLHKASEHKEALTEHLCTIIRENELRKAKKLEELVEKLEADSLAAFEAELEAVEAAKKAESQRHLSSSSTGSTTEAPKRTSSVSSSGESPSTEKIFEITSPELIKDSNAQQTSPTPGKETKDSLTGSAQTQRSSTVLTNATAGTDLPSSQGQSSSTSPTGDGALVHTAEDRPDSMADSSFGKQDTDMELKRVSSEALKNSNLESEVHT